MAKDVIVALDFPTADATLDFLSKFEGNKPFVKIGMELFYSAGAQFVKKIADMGHKIFLDLKLCDIPNTVKSAMSVLSSLGVEIVNVHAFGSKAMMSAAVEGLTRQDGTRPLIIAVTVLTSVDEATLQKEMLVSESMERTVKQYALNAKEAGLDGVVCSAYEAAAVKQLCGERFVTVTPGIRFADGDVGDQKRVTTPAMARDMRADYIVVGRAVTRAADPVAAYERCLKEFLNV